MGKPTMTAKGKNQKKYDAYWTFCDEIRAGFNRTSKFDRCSRIEIYAYFKTDIEALWEWPHDRKPDATNILKGIEDALLIDDSGNEVKCQKRWGPIDKIRVYLYGVQF